VVPWNREQDPSSPRGPAYQTTVVNHLSGGKGKRAGFSESQNHEQKLKYRQFYA
jgi:hypothetical protein